MYGLAVEHTLKDLTVWRGERGRTFFYQSELPYGVNQAQFGDHGCERTHAAARAPPTPLVRRLGPQVPILPPSAVSPPQARTFNVATHDCPPQTRATVLQTA